MNNRIKREVISNFIRNAKNNKKYQFIRGAWFSRTNLSKIEKVMCKGSKSFLTNAENLFSEATNELQAHRRDNDNYELITIFINKLLHRFYEENGFDPRRLGLFGQEIFDATCKKLFGDRYESDMEEMNKRNGGIRAPRNEHEAQMLAHYMHLREKGMNLSYDEFLEKATSRSSFESLLMENVMRRRGI